MIIKLIIKGEGEKISERKWQDTRKRSEDEIIILSNSEKSERKAIKITIKIIRTKKERKEH